MEKHLIPTYTIFLKTSGFVLHFQDSKRIPFNSFPKYEKSTER